MKEFNKKFKKLKALPEFHSNKATQNAYRHIIDLKNIEKAYITQHGKNGGTLMRIELKDFFINWLHSLPNKTYGRDEIEFCKLIIKSFEGIISFIPQYPVLSYIVDLYCPKLNICIEYDEHYHALGRNKVNDINRESAIINELKCKFIRHKEGESVSLIINKIALLCLKK